MHYAREMQIDAFELRYERFVADQQVETRRLLDHRRPAVRGARA